MAERKKQTIIVGLGEVTGHCHKAFCDCEVLAVNKDGTVAEAIIHEEADFVHEEHGTVTIPPGHYDFGHVQAFDHEQALWRNVRD